MRNQNGVTIVSLSIMVLVMIMLAAITIGGSITSLKQMKYETSIAELQEIQRAVNEVCEDYALAKEVDGNISSYSDYFFSKYDARPRLVGNAMGEKGVSELIASYGALSSNSQYTFYFDNYDIKNFLGLEVKTKSVVIDFSTRYVYSTEGVKDPTNNGYIYYNLKEMTEETNIREDVISAESSMFAVVATDENSGILQTVGNTKMLKVTLTIDRASSGRDYPIQCAYYSLDGGATYVEVDYLGDCVYTNDTVEFVIYESGDYTFMVKDTSGKQVTTSQNYLD